MKILVESPLMGKIQAIVNARPDEFTLMGKTEVIDGDIKLLDIRIPKQSCNKSTTEVSENDMIDFTDELLNDGEDPSRWNMWIHSHNTMAAFWSGQDYKQMEDFNNGPMWFCHMVVSTTGKRGAITQYKPFPLKNTELDVQVIEPEIPDEELTQMLERITAWEEEKNTIAQKIETLSQRMTELDRLISGEADIDADVASLLEELDSKTSVIKYNFGNQTLFNDEVWKYKGKRKKKKANSLVDYSDMAKVRDESDRLFSLTITHKKECSCTNCERWRLLNDYLTNYESTF